MRVDYDIEVVRNSDGSAYVHKYRVDAYGRWYESTYELTKAEADALVAALPDEDEGGETMPIWGNDGR